MTEISILYDTNIRDIPEMLRQMADNIEETGECPDSVVVIHRHPNGEIVTFGWGDADIQTSYILCHQAARDLLERL